MLIVSFCGICHITIPFSSLLSCFCHITCHLCLAVHVFHNHVCTHCVFHVLFKFQPSTYHFCCTSVILFDVCVCVLWYLLHLLHSCLHFHCVNFSLLCAQHRSSVSFLSCFPLFSTHTVFTLNIFSLLCITVMFA